MFIKKLSIIMLSGIAYGCSNNSISENYDIKEDEELFKPAYQEPSPSMANKNNIFQVKQKTTYSSTNCVSYNDKAYWDNSKKEKIEAPYTIILSKSLLENLRQHKDNQQSKNRSLGIEADILLNNLDGVDNYGCQKVKKDESKFRTPLSSAYSSIFSRAIISGNATIIDNNKKIQSVANIEYTGNQIRFYINKTPFFGTVWYIS